MVFIHFDFMAELLNRIMAELWNLLPGNVRVSTSRAAFNVALKTVQLDNKCCSFCDQR